MSGVLSSKRRESKCQFVATAFELYKQTIAFLTRLSARYSRLLAEDVSHLASEVVDNAVKANDINAELSAERRALREEYLLKSHAALEALDVKLLLCYEVMMENAEGCMDKMTGENKGKPVDPETAKLKLDKMAQRLGDFINKEDALLKGALRLVTNPQGEGRKM